MVLLHRDRVDLWKYLNTRTADPTQLLGSPMENIIMYLTRENGFLEAFGSLMFLWGIICVCWCVDAPSQSKWSVAIPTIAWREKYNYVVTVVRQLQPCSAEIVSCLIAFWKMKSNIYDWCLKWAMQIHTKGSWVCFRTLVPEVTKILLSIWCVVDRAS